jgi:hypothetical protein
VIAGDICVDRSPPMVFDLVADDGNECSDDPKMAVTLLTDEPTGIGSPFRVRWSVEPPHAVEGAVSGVNGRWRHRGRRRRL